MLGKHRIEAPHFQILSPQYSRQMRVLVQSPQLQHDLLCPLSLRNFPTGCEMHVLALNVDGDENRRRPQAPLASLSGCNPLLVRLF
jgi:hypothetical protein